MVGNCFCIILICASVVYIKAARILVVAPTASISHQVEFRPLTQGLVKRGHEVVVITTDPMYPKGKSPANLTEIDVHDVTYAAKSLGFAASATGTKNDIYIQIKSFFQLFHVMFEAVIKADEVQAIIKYNKNHFDLLIMEAYVRPALIFSHIFKAPVVLFSSLGALGMMNDYTGPSWHPLLYPTCIHQRINNLTLWEKAEELYKQYLFESQITALEQEGDVMLRRNFGNDIPPIRELRKNVDMVFLTEYHIWDNNRPVPPNLIYLGGIYPSNTRKDLPKDIKSYLDSSEHGVIYMSFGTNVNCSMLPQQAIHTFVKVFSKLPYDILIKWDSDVLPGATNNVKLMRWLPQSDLLHHPKIKLFITQGGMQSTHEAILATVPLIGIPMLGDQWYNVEQYVRLKIGLKLDIETITEEKLLSAIATVINDKSYRPNIELLRSSIHDQPQTALDRAVWWSEYVIRHKGAPYLRAPTTLISNWDYFEVDLLLALASCVILIEFVIAAIIYKLIIFCLRQPKINKTKND